MLCSQRPLAISRALICRSSHQAILISGLMNLPMVTAAERHGELIADFEAYCSGLRKAQVMWIGRLPATDQARL